MPIFRRAALLAGTALLAGCATIDASAPALESHAGSIIVAEGLQFRDLDRDGALTPYEDWRRSPEERAADLLARMTLAEKAGQMVVGSLAGNAPFGQPSTGYDLSAAQATVNQRHITHLISRLATGNAALAEANNAVQQVAEQGRLGIPALIMTDPRHGFTELAGASVAGGQFAQFPNGVGIAALDNPDLTRQYAELVRERFARGGLCHAARPANRSGDRTALAAQFRYLWRGCGGLRAPCCRIRARLAGRG